MTFTTAQSAPGGWARRNGHSRLSIVPAMVPDMTDHTGDFEYKAFADWLRSWGAADTTISNRITTIQAGARAWGDPLVVDGDTLAGWLGNPDYSAWTRVAYYGHLRSFFGWLLDTGKRDDDPTSKLRRPKTPVNRPRPLTADEVDRALEAAKGRQRTWLLLALLAGLRAHEIAKLRGEDITRESIYVMGKGGQAALIPTHPALWELAKAHPRTGWWFPSPTASGGYVSPKSISTLTTRLFIELGIDGSIHRCRHTYATRLLRGGATIRVVQDLMRHSNLATTAAYLAVDDDERRAAIGGLVA